MEAARDGPRGERDKRLDDERRRQDRAHRRLPVCVERAVAAAQEETFDGLWATCVQHEIDHLDGKLFINYLKPLKRQMITRKMQKLKRERARDKV